MENVLRQNKANYVHKSEEFVWKWVMRNKEQINVDSCLRRGKIRGTSENEDKIIFELYQQKPLF